MQPSPLVRIYPAIDQERLVGHVGVAHEHHDGFNNILRLAEPANRDARHQFLLGTWPAREHARISNQGGGHGVDRHAVRSKPAFAAA